ncbi:serine/threonine protein kinase [Halorhabdus utahensis DSM 12940]|uniref:Serine/threonine protein kinase n=1 Tax=Halorhabdus utahensis (strain DSM 12940 / JCM 11049 / AX-2) TaxID=519442 RepID=C7NS26_HALUD|nr:serine/threonine protein kinase [Halorhabdus utahensis]ACV10633.1 serine/threonine protein kinase [Halorhabdus utahensis DSM 12940]
MANANDTRDPFETVQSVIDEPAAGADQLPYLIGLLDEDDPAVRLASAFALCLIALAEPDTVTYIAGRLSDRLDGDIAEVEFAFAYLATRFPRRFDDGLMEAPTGHRDRPAERTEAGGNAPADDVGRVRPPNSGFDPRNVDSNRSVIDPADPQRHDDPAREQLGGGSNLTGHDESDSAGATGGERMTTTERQRWNQLFERLSEIVEYSRFEELMMLSGQHRGRYADVARVLTVDEGVERALALRLFHRPPSDELGSFEEELCAALDRWQGIDAHPNIATVHDWNATPQPWAATDLYETTLADRVTPVDPSVAISIGIDIADALAHAHRHGVIHGGLDPRTIGLPGITDEQATGSGAALINVGLLEVYRFHVTPASCLDPRYAAPEYYDRQFGRIDHTTDVYHLGAVLYRLLTGRPPFLGEFETIREDVMSAAPPIPSLVVDVPDDIDSVITKAMAKRTLRRYETINDLRQDLVRVHDELTGREGDGSERP